MSSLGLGQCVKDLALLWYKLQLWISSLAQELLYATSVGVKKKNHIDKIIPLAVIWMDLEIIILSEISQRERQIISYGITYM